MKQGRLFAGAGQRGQRFEAVLSASGFRYERGVKGVFFNVRGLRQGRLCTNEGYLPPVA